MRRARGGAFASAGSEGGAWQWCVRCEISGLCRILKSSIKPSYGSPAPFKTTCTASRSSFFALLLFPLSRLFELPAYRVCQSSLIGPPLSHHASYTAVAIMFPPPELKAVSKEVAELLKERGETLSVVETVWVPPAEFKLRYLTDSGQGCGRFDRGRHPSHARCEFNLPGRSSGMRVSLRVLLLFKLKKTSRNNALF